MTANDDEPLTAMLALILASAIAVSDTAPENYCHDPEVNADWERLMVEHRGDRMWERLYAMRARLCRDVDAGRVSLEDAIEQFEAARQEEIERARRALDEEPGGGAA